MVTAQKLDHRAVAERAIGHALPHGAEVHHVDGNRQNNAPGNLVICPSHAYHVHLHKRTEAMAETGDPNKRFCGICRRWDLGSNMIRAGGERPRTVHAVCNRAYQRARYMTKRAACEAS